MSDSIKPQLVFDFGLILEHSAVHYSGLLCAVSMRSTVKKKLSHKHGTSDETLAFGGRFDNNVANF